MSGDSARPPRPWYREGMVWMVIAIPFTAVVLGIAMVTIAITTWDGTVVDDYYKHGKEINRVLVRDQFATRHGLRADLQWSVADGRLSLNLTTDGEIESVSELAMQFLHPTRGGLDREVVLARGPDGRYHGVVSALPEGGWIIQLGTEEWRLSARTEVRGAEPLEVRFEPLEG
ncbi:MAG: hypothetical protein DWQ08_11530 [Proteobacteria bacterium]|nr:MAG: hypothetical protein DWQ08_11530 [Pseudomonadota bacterium]